MILWYQGAAKNSIFIVSFALAVQIWQSLAMLSPDQVKHIAQLARLGLQDNETGKFAQQLVSIFEYIHVLDEVNTDNVEPTSQVTRLENVMRKDGVRRFSTKDELLTCTELPVEKGQIKVKPVITF